LICVFQLGDKNDPTLESLIDGQHWAFFAVAVGVFVDVIRRFLGNNGAPHFPNPRSFF
jgi:hypothetical protein